jgi:hypothetical protein
MTYGSVSVRQCAPISQIAEKQHVAKSHQSAKSNDAESATKDKIFRKLRMQRGFESHARCDRYNRAAMIAATVKTGLSLRR